MKVSSILECLRQLGLYEQKKNENSNIKFCTKDYVHNVVLVHCSCANERNKTRNDPENVQIWYGTKNKIVSIDVCTK